MKIRTEILESRKISIIDDVLSRKDIDEFYTFVKSLSFTKFERDNKTDEYPIFSVDFNPDVFEEKVEIGKIARKLLNDFTENTNYTLHRSYINMSHYGDMEYPHRDCPVSQTDITCLYYVNNEWDYKWGGETMFYENNETRLAVLPTPGRFVLFYGAIEHIGSIPSRICKTSRLSLALKFREQAPPVTPVV